MVSSTGSQPSYYSYAKNIAFALVPSVAPSLLSAFFRPTFESHLATNKRQLAYFLLSSFIPTVFTLRWYNLTWKTSLVVSAGLTLAAKYFSDKPGSSPKSSSSNKSGPNESSLVNDPVPKNPSKKSKIIPEKKLDVVQFTSSNPLVVTVPELLFNQTENLPAETVLKSLIPGEYQVVIHKNVISIDDKKTENAFKFWVNKLPEQDLNMDDIAILQRRIRYRDLDENQRKEVRKSIYQSFFDQVTKEPIKLPFRGYSGEAITLKQENSELVISLDNETSFFQKLFQIVITNNGNISSKYFYHKNHYLKCINTQTNEVLYELSCPTHLTHVSPSKGVCNDIYGTWDITYVSEHVCYFSIDNEDEQTIQVFHGAQYKDGNLSIPHPKNYCNKSYAKSPEFRLEPGLDKAVKYSSNKSRSCLELLIFKFDEINAFLNHENTGQAKKAFQGCYNALSSFQKGLTQLTENASSQSLISSDENIQKSSYSFGPMWNPVVASEDSFFTWHITTNQETDDVSLRLEKGSAGRGMMGGTAQREVTITKGKTPNLLTVEIFKSNTNDLEHHSSSSKYLVEDKEKQGVFVTPLGEELNSLCVPFFLGMDFYQKNEAKIQLPDQIQKDMDFMLNVLSTLNDIKSSPDTIILDEQRNLICDLQGNPVPTERIKQINNYRQAGLGAPLVWFDDRYRKGNELFWNGKSISNSLTALPTTNDNKSI